jgi:hypothetical protein
MPIFRSPARFAQQHQPAETRCELGRALRMHAHAALFQRVAGFAPAAEHHRHGRAIQFRQRHHQGGFDRGHPARVCFPFFQRLEFQRGGADIGHVQPRQHCLGGGGIVIGRAADQ